MNTHVFVVDTTTFGLHLEYMFAGTGAKDKQSPFLCVSNSTYNANIERNLVGMIADISRIRKGDNIVFYLQSSSSNQGMFFGVFKAKSCGFFDENDADNYLANQLCKGLSFRILIEPYKVYPKGISEHEYLDSLEHKEKPYQLCWSMIYRKLKGNRGCTMLLPYEYDDLLKKLNYKNNNKHIDNNAFSYCAETREIIQGTVQRTYKGKKDSIDILSRLMYKSNKQNAFETHLQAYILQNFDKEPLRDYLLGKNDCEVWVGNEVSCGVGMQRIDILIIEETKSEVHIKIMELKDEEPYDSIIDDQLPWYVEWASYYIVPNYEKKKKQIFIHPYIIAKESNNDLTVNRIKNELIRCAVSTSAIICSTKYLGFRIENQIFFKDIV